MLRARVAGSTQEPHLWAQARGGCDASLSDENRFEMCTSKRIRYLHRSSSRVGERCHLSTSIVSLCRACPSAIVNRIVAFSIRTSPSAHRNIAEADAVAAAAAIPTLPDGSPMPMPWKRLLDAFAEGYVRLGPDGALLHHDTDRPGDEEEGRRAREQGPLQVLAEKSGALSSARVWRHAGALLASFNTGQRVVLEHRCLHHEQAALATRRCDARAAHARQDKHRALHASRRTTSCRHLRPRPAAASTRPSLTSSSTASPSATTEGRPSTIDSWPPIDHRLRGAAANHRPSPIEASSSS